MKRLSKVLCIVFSVAIMLSCTTAFADTKTEEPKQPAAMTTGTFLQSWYWNGMSNKKVKYEFNRMHEIGIDTIVMSFFSQSDTNKWDTYYNSSITDVDVNVINNDDSKVDYAFDMCKKYGVKMFVEMGSYNEWWDKQPVNEENKALWLDMQAKNAKFTEEFYNKFIKGKHEDEFAGFYFTPEFWNHDKLDDDATRDFYVDAIAEGMNIDFDLINKLDPDKPLMFSPFQKDYYDTATREHFMDFYKKLFLKAKFRDNDIICPQDSVGANNVRLEVVEDWWKLYKDMIGYVHDHGKNIKLWANCEDFASAYPNDDFQYGSPSLLKRFVTQMQIASKYVEKIISFADTHYYSPQNIDKGFDEAYRYYIANGKIKEEVPSLCRGFNIMGSKITDISKAQIEYPYGTTPHSSCIIDFEDTQGYDDEAIICKYEIYKKDPTTGKYDLYKRWCMETGRKYYYFSHSIEMDYPDQDMDLQIVGYDYSGNKSNVCHLVIPKDFNGLNMQKFVSSMDGTETYCKYISLQNIDVDSKNIELYDNIKDYDYPEGLYADVPRPDPDIKVDGYITPHFVADPIIDNYVVKRPDRFDPWFSFENLNVGAKPYITGDNDEKTCTVNGINTIASDYLLEQKNGILDCSVVSGGLAGKLLSYGAGPNMTINRENYSYSYWWPITINELSDEKYCDKEIKDEEYFSFYVDMTNWTADSRVYDYDEDYLSLCVFFQIEDQTITGSRCNATSCLKAGRPYELQDENGNWVSYTTPDVDSDVKDIVIPATQKVVRCRQQNGQIVLSPDYKGYVRFKIADTYPCTYYDATNPDHAINKVSSFKMNGIQLHMGLNSEVVRVADDMPNPGHALFGDFGFIKKEDVTPEDETSKVETSEDETSQDETSKVETSEDENSQGEASKIEESAKDTDNTAVIPEAKTDANTTTTAKADKKASVPKTGDTAPLSLMVIGLIAVGSALVVKHKK